MDGQNFQNEQNQQNEQNPSFDSVQSTTNNYQDYTTYAQPQTVVEEQPKQTNALAIVSLVLGILSLVTCCCTGWLSMILSIGGIVCAVLANKKSKSGMATAGLICSIVGILLGLVSIIFSAALSVALLEELDSYSYY